jgi:hypothetical protein
MGIVRFIGHEKGKERLSGLFSALMPSARMALFPKIIIITLLPVSSVICDPD